jgi:hypothetical protein
MSDDKHFHGIDNMVKYYTATEDSTDDMIRWGHDETEDFKC